MILVLSAVFPHLTVVSKSRSADPALSFIFGCIVIKYSMINDELLAGAKFFVFYLGKGTEEGKKGLFITLSLQYLKCTLEDADIAGSVDAIVASISEKFGAALRD